MASFRAVKQTLAWMLRFRSWLLSRCDVFNTFDATIDGFNEGIGPKAIAQFGRLGDVPKREIGAFAGLQHASVKQTSSRLFSSLDGGG